MKLKSLTILTILCSALFVKAQTPAAWNASGIILSSGGYIATINHPLEPGYHFEVDVFNNGVKRTYLGNLVKTDPSNDLAVLKVDDPIFTAIGTAPFTFKMRDVKKDEKVFVLGYPKINAQGGEMKLSEGNITSKSGFPNDITMYQISCAMEPGHAGAPLFDNFGNLIGIINSGVKSGQNNGYAIKISCLNNILDVIPKMPPMPAKTVISGYSLADKVEALTKFIVSIRMSNQAISDTANSKKMFVGQAFGGGIIFYVDQTGEHGLIASIDNGDSERAQWGCYNTVVDETETGIGSGQENTKKIVTACRTAGTQNIAARLCNQLVLEGFSDWFLPSKEELNLLYEQKEIIGGYEHGYYWSSSEFDQHFAWYQHFDFGFQDYLNKDLLYYFRPIRSF